MNEEYHLLRRKFSINNATRIAKYNSRKITNFAMLLKQRNYDPTLILKILKQLKNDTDQRIDIFEKLSSIQTSEKTLTNITNLFNKDFDLNFYNQVLFTLGQIQSKKWLVDILNLIIDKPVSVCIVASWFSLLSRFLFDFSTFEILKIDCIDIDPNCFLPSIIINKDEARFNMIIDDMFTIDYNIYDVIINTSCEHISLKKWLPLIPKGKIVVLQSCNLIAPDHLEPVNSIQEFKEKCNLEKTYYLSNKILNQYTRFMIIGEI